MGLQVAVPENVYPHPITRQTLVINKTVPQICPLFIAGSKGAILDFVRVRYGVVHSAQSVGTIRYTADATDNTSSSGSAVSTGVIDFGDYADTLQTFTLLDATRQIPANAVVYISFSVNPTALDQLVVDIGYRQLTN